ncbi:unnamed protein product [Brachionus calyciflorus]|uniref:Synembryn n=1 Tax=Brachionus calyciflorus TaxID=104777 RepID=A0A813W8A7_9BILA|nr:unnamed protein product [Brachionus calyciflorus]
MALSVQNLIEKLHMETSNDLIVNQILEFNKLNSTIFNFGHVTDSDATQKFHDKLLTILKMDAKLNSNQITGILDMIRLISRDTTTVTIFEHSDLLDQVQKIAGLKLNTEIESDVEQLSLSALMSMSNLIYNSKYAQDFYSQNNVAESVTIFLKQFQLSDVLNQGLKQQITIFKLRILFLLTVFNKDLRSKLREKLQVTSYLIELIDLVMKERLQVSENETDVDYCYLKQVDLEFLNELLKILYNLTMDIAKPNLNFSNPSQCQAFSNEEEEAHLMHLVSVLKDLMTCRLEQENYEKLNNLHTNIINLLTNMPCTCFEELMTPCNSTKIQATRFESTNHNNYYMNARLAHNKKRQSRRSRRLRQKDETLKKTSKEIEYENFFLSFDEDLEFEGKNMEAIAMILSFLNRHINNYVNKTIGSSADQIYPVLLLLSLMCKSNNIIRHYSRLKVLPPLKKKDLVQLPQSGSHLRNRLVKLMTDSNLQVKRLVAQLLFILCKESVARFVKYTGYGNAAGLLAEAGLMLSSHGDKAAYSSDSDNSDTEDYKQLEECINPVTGRAEIEDAKLDMDSKKYIPIKRDIFEGMSEEQKEYEAVQLANAIDKLTRLGSGSVIKPATIGPDGKVIELSHVLEIQEKALEKSIKKIQEKNDSD